MRLGICTRYKRCEATQVALRIADWAYQAGCDVTLYTPSPTAPRLNSCWDAELQTSKDSPFTKWACTCSTVLWTHTPPIEQLAWVHKRGINTTIVNFWHELNDFDLPTLQAAHSVISPSRHAAEHLTESQVKRSVSIPWDVGLPFTQKDPRLVTERQWVLLPLFDHEPSHMESTSIEIAGRMLHNCPGTVLTVAFNASTLAPFAVRRLQEFKHCFGDRVRLLRSVPMQHRPLVFQEHDLTLWPVHAANTGMIGLMSLNMGTPVAAYNFPPTCEFLDDQNSIRVPVDSYRDFKGVPHIEPDYEKFERILQSRLNTQGFVKNLQRRVLHGMAHRRTVFTETLARVVV